MADFKFKPGKRKQIETHILKRMREFDTSGYNYEYYKDLLPTLSDADLNKMIDDEDGVPLFTELGSRFKTSLWEMRNYLVKKMGIEISRHIYTTDSRTGLIIKSIFKHMILKLPTRVQTQSYEKKSSITKHNRAIDQFTHQVTGPSKSSSFSFPEAYLTLTEGNLVETTKELIHGRGGNLELQRAIQSEIIATGKGSLNQPMVKSAAKAPKTLGKIYRAMHIGSNFGEVE